MDPRSAAVLPPEGWLQHQSRTRTGKCALALVVLSVAAASCGSGGPGGLKDGGAGGGSGDAGGPLTVGGAVSGLAGGATVGLALGSETLAVTGNGRFSFTTTLADGATYTVSVATQPAAPAHSCVVRNPTGTIAGASVGDVIVDCVPALPRYALVADRADDSVSTYAVDGASGRLTLTGKAATGAGPTAIVVAPSGRFAYVTGGDISQYAVGADGALTALAPPTVVVGAGLRGVAVDRAGRYAYAVAAASEEVTAYAIAAGGTLTRVGSIAAHPTPGAIAIDPTGRFVYVGHASGALSQYTIGGDGTLAPMSNPTVPAGADPGALVVDPTGRFAYAGNLGDGTVSQYAIGAGGALTPLAPATFSVGGAPVALAIEPTGRFALVSRVGAGGAGDVLLLAIGAGGALAAVASAPATGVEPDPRAIAVDGGGEFLYVAGGTSASVSLFTLARGGGAVSLLPNRPARVAAQVSPSALALVAGDAPVQAIARYAYVADDGADTLSLFTVGATGGLTLSDMLSVAGKGPDAIAVDPSGRFAYVANYRDDSVSQYAVGADGRLTPLTPDTVDAGTFPKAIAIHPSGRFVYVVNQMSDNVSQYAVGSGGLLSALTPATVAIAAGTPSAIVVDPSGRYVFVTIASGSVARFSIDSNGSLTPAAPATVTAGMSPNGLAVTPSGEFLYVANSRSNSVSQYGVGAGGALALAPATAATGTFPAALALDPSAQHLYVVDTNSSDVAQFAMGADGTVAALSPARVAVGTAGTNNPVGIAVDPSGRYAYVVDNLDPTGTIWQFAIGAGGALAAMTPPSLRAGTSPLFIAITGRFQ